MGIQIENRVGSGWEVPGGRLIPVSKALLIGSPEKGMGLVWNRPSAVLLSTPSGEEHLVPVPDYTRRAQLALLGFGLIGALLIRLARR